MSRDKVSVNTNSIKRKQYVSDADKRIAITVRLPARIVSALKMMSEPAGRVIESALKEYFRNIKNSVDK